MAVPGNAGLLWLAALAEQVAHALERYFVSRRFRAIGAYDPSAFWGGL